jgi:elongator complex protein 4
VPCLHAIAAALDAAGPSGVARVILEIAPEHDLSSTALTRLLLSLRSILRPRAAVGIITLPARLSSRAPELAHAADAAIVLAGFGTAPLAAAYAPAHGLLTPLKLNARGHVIAPALRHSALLGVAAGSEQNLGFRLKRRRWVVESVHLGIEGGSGERRTEPVSRPVAATAAGPPVVSTAVEGIDTPPAPAPAPAPSKTIPAKEKKPRARVRFGEDEVMVSLDSGKPPVARGHDHGPLKAKMAPKVAIRHDRPDLYEF